MYVARARVRSIISVKTLSATLALGASDIIYALVNACARIHFRAPMWRNKPLTIAAAAAFATHDAASVESRLATLCERALARLMRTSRADNHPERSHKDRDFIVDAVMGCARGSMWTRTRSSHVFEAAYMRVSESERE